METTDTEYRQLVRDLARDTQIADNVAEITLAELADRCLTVRPTARGVWVLAQVEV